MVKETTHILCLLTVAFFIISSILHCYLYLTFCDASAGCSPNSEAGVLGVVGAATAAVVAAAPSASSFDWNIYKFHKTGMTENFPQPQFHSSMIKTAYLLCGLFWLVFRRRRPERSDVAGGSGDDTCREGHTFQLTGGGEVQPFSPVTEHHATDASVGGKDKKVCQLDNGDISAS